jgi:hypothetical protein
MSRVLSTRGPFVLLFLSEELLVRYSRSGSLDSIPAYDGALPLFQATLGGTNAFYRVPLSFSILDFTRLRNWVRFY